MKKHVLTFLLLLQLALVPCAMTQDNPQQAVQTKYGVSSASNSVELQTALSQAISDLQANQNDATAFYALSVIYGWVPLSDRFKLNLDLFLQPQSAFFMGGVKGINEFLETGEFPEATLKQQISDALWTKLGGLEANGDANSDLARAAVEVLIKLKDDRGLEAILTDRSYVENLQAIDQWNDESPTTTFAELKQKYEGLIGQRPGARELAALYELCRLRKVSGVRKIQTTSSVIDLANF